MADSNLSVLVTGGAGFIGSHLAEALVAEGHRVRVVDNLATGRVENLDHLGGRIEFLEGDLADPSVCKGAVEGVEYVFHQAAIPSVPRSVKEPLESHASGPTATLNLLEASRNAGVRRFMFAASSSAYGDTDELPKHEEMLPRPLSPYAAGKLAGEHYVRVYARTMGLDGVSLRYFNVFGPRQDPSSPYSGVISLFSKAAAEGRRPIIYGDGLQTRDFTHVSNVVRANLLAMQVGSAAAGRGVQRRDRGADQPSGSRLGDQRSARDERRARIPTGEGGRRARLAGRPVEDRRGDRLRAGRRLRGGAPAHAGEAGDGAVTADSPRRRARSSLDAGPEADDLPEDVPGRGEVAAAAERHQVPAGRGGGGSAPMARKLPTRAWASR